MAYEIELKELPDRYVVTIRTSTTPDKLGEAFQELLPEVDAQILEAGERPSGPAFAIYHDYREDHVDMETGFPVGEPIPTEGRVIGRELVATPAAVRLPQGHVRRPPRGLHGRPGMAHGERPHALGTTVGGLLGRADGQRGFLHLEHRGRVPHQRGVSSGLRRAS